MPEAYASYSRQIRPCDTAVELCLHFAWFVVLFTQRQLSLVMGYMGTNSILCGMHVATLIRFLIKISCALDHVDDFNGMADRQHVPSVVTCIPKEMESFQFF